MEITSSQTQHILSAESAWDFAGWMLLVAGISAIFLVILMIALVAMLIRKK